MGPVSRGLLDVGGQWCQTGRYGTVQGTPPVGTPRIPIGAVHPGVHCRPSYGWCTLASTVRVHLTLHGAGAASQGYNSRDRQSEQRRGTPTGTTLPCLMGNVDGHRELPAISYQ